MLLTLVTRSNVGYMNEKCTVECSEQFATELAKRMFMTNKDNKYVEVYEGRNLYFGDSRVKPWLVIKPLGEDHWSLERKYEIL